MMLKIDWANHESAVYACKNWHYSKSVPAGKLVKVGVWEDDVFVGVVLFSRGANKSIASPYGLTQFEVCELTRVALRNHKTAVTRILSIAINFLKRQSPGLRLIVSYADVDQGHTGGIYKGGNWLYEGCFNKDAMGAFIIHGKKTHPKTVHSKYGKGSQRLSWIRANLDANASVFITKGKHKYLMPLDNEMKEKIEFRRKPYPRAASVDSDTSDFQSEKGGANPTAALQKDI